MATVGFHAAKFSGGTVIFNDAEFSGSVGFVDAGFSGGEIRSFRRIYDRNRIIVIKVYHLRHTTASLLKRLRVAPHDAQMILGHARISTTMRITPTSTR